MQGQVTRSGQVTIPYKNFTIAPQLPDYKTWQISTRSRACAGCLSSPARRALANIQACTPRLRRARGFRRKRRRTHGLTKKKKINPSMECVHVKKILRKGTVFISPECDIQNSIQWCTSHPLVWYTRRNRLLCASHPSVI